MKKSFTVFEAYKRLYSVESVDDVVEFVRLEADLIEHYKAHYEELLKGLDIHSLFVDFVIKEIDNA